MTFVWILAVLLVLGWLRFVAVSVWEVRWGIVTARNAVQWALIFLGWIGVIVAGLWGIVTWWSR